MQCTDRTKLPRRPRKSLHTHTRLTRTPPLSRLRVRRLRCFPDMKLLKPNPRIQFLLKIRVMLFNVASLVRMSTRDLWRFSKTEDGKPPHLRVIVNMGSYDFIGCLGWALSDSAISEICYEAMTRDGRRRAMCREYVRGKFKGCAVDFEYGQRTEFYYLAVGTSYRRTDCTECISSSISQFAHNDCSYSGFCEMQGTGVNRRPICRISCSTRGRFCRPGLRSWRSCSRPSPAARLRWESVKYCETAKYASCFVSAMFVEDTLLQASIIVC